MVSEPIPDPDMEFVPFGPAIPWDTTRTLCLHKGGGGGGGGGGLSHPTSDRGETS